VRQKALKVEKWKGASSWLCSAAIHEE